MYYTYEIVKISTQERYVGSRTCKGSSQSDLGKRYFSSSTNLGFIREQKNNPLNFLYIVLKEFDKYSDMLEHEIYLHKYNEVEKNPSFINKARQTSTAFYYDGLTGVTGEDHPRYGKKDSIETKKQKSISASARAKPSEATRAKIAKASALYRHTTKTKLKLKQLARNRSIEKCVHCCFSATKANLACWHNNNCKLNPANENNVIGSFSPSLICYCGKICKNIRGFHSHQRACKNKKEKNELQKIL